MIDNQSFHFIGIGGTGMSGIAKVLLELGYDVSGSDINTSETTKRLERMGAAIYLNHDEKNLKKNIDTVVVSSAIPNDNPEVIKAKDWGIPVVQRAEMLSSLMKRQKGIAVAGAHGKTTTSSMISLIMEKCGCDPTVVVGGEINDIGGNAKLGKGEYLVAEADESDGSFLKLLPHVVVVTNVENDHLDYYGSRENIEKAFYKFINNTVDHGYAILCLDDPVLARMIPKIEKEKKVITYGLSDQADFSVSELELNVGYTKAKISFNGKELGELELSVPGKHNVQNAVAAVAVGISCGLEFADIKNALKTFRGAQRRFQKVGTVKDILIVDDYAHHPTELKATLNAVKTLKPKRIVAVFQPHRYSRTMLLADEFGMAFVEADILIMTKIYAAGEKALPNVTAQLIVDAVKEQSGQQLEYIDELKDIKKRLAEIVRPGDIVITLGAGDIWTVGVDLYHELCSQS